MMDDKEPVLVPDNQSGVSSHTEEIITLPSEEEAIRLYEVAKHRLLQVSSWKRWAGEDSAEFTLTDENGNEVDRPAQLGDHFKINIPAPGNTAGSGYDWVQVEAIEDKESEIEGTSIISMRVRPSDNPQEPAGGTAHFFNDEASSTFTVRRDKNEVRASVHGRNEKPNTGTSKITDKIRNAVVAVGAMAGLNKPQWEKLLQGILRS